MRNVFVRSDKNSSVMIAKERLKLLLISDRANCTPDKIEKLYEEIYSTISKYIEITPDSLDINISDSNICINLKKDCSK